MSYSTPAEAASLDDSLAETDITPEMLRWADGQVDRWLGKSYVAEAQVTEDVDGSGTAIVVLSNRPVTAVLSVVVSNWPESAAPFDASGYVWYENGQLALRPWPADLSLLEPVWPMGRQNVRVTYKYGLHTGVKIPPDVQFAAAQATAIIAKYAKQGLLGSLGEDWSVGDVSIKTKGNADLGAAIQGVLESTLGSRPPAIF